MVIIQKSSFLPLRGLQMTRKAANILNMSFGQLTVIKELEERRNGRVMFTCKCSCGNIINLRSTSIISGNTKSCGKCNRIGGIQNITNEFYSNLLAALQYKKSYTISDTCILELVEDMVAIHFRPLVYSNTSIIQNNKHNLNILTDYATAGYKVITIYENEWKLRKEQVLNFLGSVLHSHTNKVFARKCTLSIVPKETALVFLEKTHIQGPGVNNILYIGLHYNNVLLSVMTFGLHHRNINKSDVVLNRFSVSPGWSIPGGASKLLAFSIKQLKLLGYVKIISWADRRYSTGNVYDKLGFVLEDTLLPDYCYYNLTTGQIESKQSNKKSNLNTVFGMTELEHTKLLGKERIYDCGKLRFVLAI